MIKFIRNLNFGYFLLIAGPVVAFVGYQNIMSPPADPTAASGGPTWLKGAAILLAGLYLIFAGGLKIYKAKPKRGKY
ncbi:hypothetical protein CEQ90_09910 [Lewinellaceae bacterium SD302]|nr:hypothetical protein CEQ90_09910 [Lewinellaceae bacterium SD302]